jgi:hypothetical protein
MKTSIFILMSVVCGFSVAMGQIIPIKTVPVATGDQFAIFPSANMASGGISVAADDGMLDPFTNPAKGSLIDGLRVVSAPQMYSISIKRGTSEGSGYSIPIGALTRKGNFFGGLYWARQQLSSEQNSVFGVTPTVSGSAANVPNDPEYNTYSFAMLGGSIPGADLEVGASVLWGALNAVEGVNLLFPRSPKVFQNGTLTDFRFGAVRRMDGDKRLEAIVLRSMFKMRYDVGTAVTSGATPSSSLQFNPEYDQTNLWGLQLRYTRPLAEFWRVGALLTANWKDHPKIPNYDLMSVPRDPGNSTAYNLGVGLFRSEEYAYFGVDLVYEPIETETWAEANQTVASAYGSRFVPGTKTVENFFSFSNWIGRMGFRTGTETSAFQFGLQLHWIHYDFEQFNNLQNWKRKQRESWVEWALTGGYGFSFGPARFLYTALVTIGTGQPTVSSAGWTSTAMSAGSSVGFDAADFLPAPSGSLNIQKGFVWTHMVSLLYDID